MVQGINSQITLMCSNLLTAIEFYTKVLGFKLEKQYGEHYAELIGAGTRIGLHPNKEIITGNALQLGIEVKNLEQAKTTLQNHLVSFNQSEEPGIILVHFNDPDGNLLYLMAKK